ncbi:GIN domain-containing protein [Phenylobacterium deserti]|uniref:Putative auto-transporter adhesin head GIN domain-containing protein n=1 Tax=Phenylobacterium deserti TaxID=1914756 RepID=A0A328ACI1_9CAUL|nr:DUF2807 domain-containing protein [Phenylobacterium deserti]RAK51084.1 hypothetical protein DJ018_18205 [Phenylobacterium deserti]
MRLPVVGLAAAAVLCAGAAHAQSVEIKDAVARVTVVPEDRGDVKVEVIRGNPRLPLQVRSMGGRTIVDGDLRMNRIRNCGGEGANSRVEVAGIGPVAWRDMPEVVIRTPRNVKVSAGGAVFGSVGRAASVDLANAGCGDWLVADVQGELKLSQAGSGDTRAGSSGRAHVRVAGSGDVAAAVVRGPLQVDVAGSGDVAVGSVNGELDVRIAGSGDVRIGGGRANEMKVSIAGSGDVDFRGVADSLKARVAGSGDVRAREVRGPVSKQVIGSGGVTIG